MSLWILKFSLARASRSIGGPAAAPDVRHAFGADLAAPDRLGSERKPTVELYAVQIGAGYGAQADPLDLEAEDMRTSATSARSGLMLGSVRSLRMTLTGSSKPLNKDRAWMGSARDTCDFFLAVSALDVGIDVGD